MKLLNRVYRGVKRRIDNWILNVYYTYSRNKYGLNTTEKRKNKVIVSLTSYPGRLPFLHLCIKSLLNQTYKPDQVILYLDDTVKDEEIPKILLEQRDFGLTIEKRPENIKPHKKYYYSMKEHPDAIIITVDDDMIYHTDLVETLIKTHELYPKYVIARRVHKILFDRNGDVLPYNKWELECTSVEEPSKLLLATGVGGVLYPPKSMSCELFDIDKIQKFSLNQDDIWLKFMQLLNSTPVVWVKTKNINPEIIKSSQTQTLNSSNVGENLNDVSIANLIDCYGYSLFAGLK